MTDDALSTVTWTELRADAEDRLRTAGLESWRVDAERIIEEAGPDAVELAAAPDTPATVRAVAYLDAMIERRIGGEPLQYVVGRWGFRELDLAVDRRVLIPRPETEQVVEVALEALDTTVADLEDRAGPDREFNVVDLGTGSGAIALSIAAERPQTRVWATDVSSDALAVTSANLAGLGRAATRVTIAEGSWFEALADDMRGHVDLIVSNPPYVADGDELPEVVDDWEPRLALRAGGDGLDAIRVIVAQAPAWLSGGGHLVLELAPDQVDAVDELLTEAGFTDVEALPDLTGRLRAIRSRWSG